MPSEREPNVSAATSRPRSWPAAVLVGLRRHMGFGEGDEARDRRRRRDKRTVIAFCSLTFAPAFALVAFLSFDPPIEWQRRASLMLWGCFLAAFVVLSLRVVGDMIRFGLSVLEARRGS